MSDITELTELEIALPARTNDAMKSYHIEHQHFKDWVLGYVGGYTELAPADGAWQDGGRTYRDRMYCYRIWLDEAKGSAEKQRKAIVAKAFTLFHDQIALAYSFDGKHCIERR